MHLTSSRLSTISTRQDRACITSETVGACQLLMLYPYTPYIATLQLHRMSISTKAKIGVTGFAQIVESLLDRIKVMREVSLTIDRVDVVREETLKRR